MAIGPTRFEVTEQDAGLRLDQVIPRRIPSLSRRKARAVIDLGGVFLDRARTKVAGRLVRAGQVVEVVIGGAFDRAGETPRAPDIVHVDDHVIVVNKPAGLVTAPTPESDRGDLLDLLSRQFGAVFLVHRLDRLTSGLLVFARTRHANKWLGDAFKAHDVDREYRAVAVGDVVAQTIDRPIKGRRAVTHVSPINRLLDSDMRRLSADAAAGPVERGSGPVVATLISARLETGRTHQIRIHLAGVGHPIAGDRLHGGETERTLSPRPKRLMLHAAILGFAHPGTRARVRWQVEPNWAGLGLGQRAAE